MWRKFDSSVNVRSSEMLYIVCYLHVLLKCDVSLYYLYVHAYVGRLCFEFTDTV